MLLKCHAGCATDGVVAKLGLTMATLFPTPLTQPRQSVYASPRNRIVETYRYCDEVGTLLYEILRYDPKDFRARRPDGAGGWIWGLNGVRRVLYQLPALLRATADGHGVVFVEGERDCHALAAVGVTATTIAGGVQGPLPTDLSAMLAGARVAILPDNDNPGRAFAARIAQSLHGHAASLKVIALPRVPDKGDATDWCESGGTRETLNALIAAAPEYVPGAHNRSASRSPTTREVRDPEEEPWPDPVNGAHLLNTIVCTVRRYIAMPREAALAVALWVVHTYASDIADFTAYLLVTSPVRECGKTTLLDVLEYLVLRPRRSDGMTAAALYRTIDRHAPTILLDELDARLAGEGGENLRSVLNSGFKPGGRVTICVGESHEARDFKTYCPKVLAGIGRPWDTVVSRSIQVRLARATPPERAKLRKLVGATIGDELAPLRRQCLRWVDDGREDLAKHRMPMVPDGLSARQADIWRPLFAIADVAGGRWLKRARAAAEALHGATEEDSELGTQALADLRAFFVERGADRLRSASIVEHLVGLEERHWSEMPGSGRPLTAAGLARVLKRFSVRPRNMRDAEGVGKGYTLADLRQVFERYLPPASSAAATAATRDESEAVAGVAAGPGSSGAARTAERESGGLLHSRAPIVAPGSQEECVCLERFEGEQGSATDPGAVCWPERQHVEQEMPR
ncbi:MAG: DUF3631 domain-containing protein [Gemmatimonadales bacterium]